MEPPDTVPEKVVAFDWDGTLNNTPVTHGNDPAIMRGQVCDLTPLHAVMASGHRVAIMTAGDPLFVLGRLLDRKVPAFADTAMEHKVPPSAGMVMVTNRKVLADVYVDDRALRWRFGMDASVIERTMRDITPVRRTWRRLWRHR